MHAGYNTRAATIICFLSLACAASALAENSSGVVEGCVLDPSGAPIPKATVAALNTRTGEWRLTRAQRDGQYRIEGLPAGGYEAIAEYPAFVTNDKDIQIEPKAELHLDFHLKIGGGSSVTPEGGRSSVFAEPHIGGTVLGLGGEPLAGARVTAENLETGETHATTSDSRGFFLFKVLPKGLYRLRAEAEGYRSQYRLAYRFYAWPQAQFHLEPVSK